MYIYIHTDIYIYIYYYIWISPYSPYVCLLGRWVILSRRSIPGLKSSAFHGIKYIQCVSSSPVRTVHWIGLREHFFRKPLCLMAKTMVSWFSLKPIQWTVAVRWAQDHFWPCRGLNSGLKSAAAIVKMWLQCEAWQFRSVIWWEFGRTCHSSWFFVIRMILSESWRTNRMSAIWNNFTRDSQRFIWKPRKPWQKELANITVPWHSWEVPPQCLAGKTSPARGSF